MRIVFYEMKKIWNVKLLLVIALLCALFYSIFMESNIEYFPNGHSATEEVAYSIEMTQRYGPTLEADEYSEFIMKTREDLISEAERYIKNNPVFAEVGIYTYADYEEVHEKQANTEAESNAIWTLLGEECDFVQFKLQALGNIEERYSNYPEYTLKNSVSETTSEKKLTRLTLIRETEEYRNIMDGWVFENTVTYTIYLAILAILAVLVFVSPLIVTDRAKNVHLLQYTAKHGRKILKEQLITVILSAFLLTTALLLVFGTIYSTNGAWPFWNNGLTSFLNLIVTFFWFDITYGQYIAIYIALLYVLCLGAAAIAFMLSRFSQNLIALIFKLIPAFAVLGALCFSVFYCTFSSTNILYMGTSIIGIEPIICGLVLIAGLAVSLYIAQREKKVDVV
jgi:hypothetical protein